MSEELIFNKGIVEKKINNNSNNPKAPKGFIYFIKDERKFTLWEQDKVDKVVTGGEYEVGFIESENLWDGKSYVNYNVKTIEDLSMEINPKKIVFSKEEIAKLVEQNQDVNKLKVGESNLGFYIMGHRIIVEEVKEIKVPEKVYHYLIEKKITDGKSN